MTALPRSFWSIALVSSIVLGAVSAGLVAVWATTPASPHAMTLYPAPPDPTSVPIQHIVIVVMENHAFDNYFGAYCQQTGPYCPTTANGIPPGQCVPTNPAQPLGGCVTPYPFLNNQSNLSTPDIQHDWQSSHIAYDNGAMDGFYTAEGYSTEPFGYYTGAEIPEYYGLAEQYALGDNFYSAVLSYSLPNHWYLVAGQAPAASVYFTLPGSGHHVLTAVERTYLNQANATHTVADLLAKSSVTWKYYDFPLPSYGAALATHRAFNYWNPFGGKAESYGANFSSHLVNVSAFHNDSVAGTLPNVSWVIPSVPESDHPPADLRTGQNWVASLVSDVERSPQWSTTAVFVTWDEYGGFYDHVAPPITDQFGPSFRVPLLVISPYTAPESIPHGFADFESLLRFIEWRYALGSLGTHDAGAPLPLGYFDFSATPRPPLLATNWTTYPAPVQALPPPNPPTRLGLVAGVGNLAVHWSEPIGGGAVGSYVVTASPLGGGGSTSFVVDGAANGVQLTGLRGGISYLVGVTAVGGPLHSPAVRASAMTLPTSAGIWPSGPLGGALLLAVASTGAGVFSAWRRAKGRAPHPTAPEEGEMDRDPAEHAGEAPDVADPRHEPPPRP